MEVLLRDLKALGMRNFKDKTIREDMSEDMTAINAKKFKSNTKSVEFLLIVYRVKTIQ